jgi:hypothetical protein
MTTAPLMDGTKRSQRLRIDTVSAGSSTVRAGAGHTLIRPHGQTVPYVPSFVRGGDLSAIIFFEKQPRTYSHSVVLFLQEYSNHPLEEYRTDCFFL